MGSESESTIGSSSTAAPRVSPPGWTIRGKLFVAPFVLVLCLLLAWTLAVAIQFQTIMTRLDRARADWPAASQDLARQFADFDAIMQSPNNAISETDRAAWIEAYAGFKQTSQYDRQSPHAATLERIRGKARNESVPLVATPAISQLQACERERIAAQQSTVGRWAITALRLKLPGTFFASE